MTLAARQTCDETNIATSLDLEVKSPVKTKRIGDLERREVHVSDALAKTPTLVEIQANVNNLRVEMREMLEQEVLEKFRQELDHQCQSIKQELQNFRQEFGHQWQSIKNEKLDLSPVIDVIRSESKNTAAAINHAKHFVPPELGVAIDRVILAATANRSSGSADLSPLLEEICSECKSIAAAIDQVKSFVNPVELASNKFSEALSNRSSESVDLSPVLEVICSESKNTASAIYQLKNFVTPQLEAAIDKLSAATANRSGESAELFTILKGIHFELKNTAAAIEQAKTFVPPQLEAAIEKLLASNTNSSSEKVDLAHGEFIEQAKNFFILQQNMAIEKLVAKIDFSPIIKVIERESDNTASAIDQLKTFVTPQLEAAIVKLSADTTNHSGESAELFTVLKSIHSELKNSAAAIEQAKAFVPSQLEAAIEKLLASTTNRSSEDVDLALVLKKIHSEFNNIAVAIEQAKNSCIVQQNMAIEKLTARLDLSPIIKVIERESDNTATAIYTLKNFLTTEVVASRSSEKVDFAPDLKAICSEAKRIAQAVDQFKHFVPLQQVSTIDQPIPPAAVLPEHDKTMAPRPASHREVRFSRASLEEKKHSESVSRRNLEPRMSVNSTRVSDALSAVSEDLASHRSECRVVWETHDLAMAEVRQTLKDLVARGTTRRNSHG